MTGFSLPVSASCFSKSNAGISGREKLRHQVFRPVHAGADFPGAAVSGAVVSSARTAKRVRMAAPNEVVMATSEASRPVAISTYRYAACYCARRKPTSDRPDIPRTMH